MQITRECRFAELHPMLYSKLNRWPRSGEPVRYCAEGRFDASNGFFRTAIVLTPQRIFFAGTVPGGGGFALTREHARIEYIEERESANGKYHYVDIGIRGADSIRFDFESAEQVHHFADLLRSLAKC